MSKAYFAKSVIQGSGIFAKRDIKKGELVFIAKGKLAGFHVDDKNDSAVGPNWIGISHDLWLSPREDNFLAFTNHSCSPNLGIKGKVCFVALKNIRKDEEMNFDYSITEEDVFWRLSCKCQSENCRKIIRSIQFLPKTVFDSYLPHIPRYFQKIYLDYNKGNEVK